MKRTMGVIGHKINMDFNGKRQRSPAKKWPSCETSGANILKEFFTRLPRTGILGSNVICYLTFCKV